MNSSALLATYVAPAWASAWVQDEFGSWAEFEYQGIAQRMRWIMPGRFLMGSPESEPQRYDDELLHEVELTEGYWLADTACTQELWQAVMEKNPSGFQGKLLPVEQVSWDDCQKFLGRLNQQIPGLELGLPTEAEWEYACRAGTSTPFSFGKNITPAQVNYDGNYPYPGGAKGKYRQKTVPVKSLPPNAWGLYEMHGNVWEWCLDEYAPYQPRLSTDPPESLGANKGERVVRGGSWSYFAGLVRSASRLRVAPGNRSHFLGFRVARGRPVKPDRPVPGKGARGAGEAIGDLVGHLAH